MAGNSVTLSFLGDSSQLSDSMSEVGSEADSMSEEVDSASESVSGLGGGFGSVGGAVGGFGMGMRSISMGMRGARSESKAYHDFMKGDMSKAFMEATRGAAGMAMTFSRLGAPLLQSIGPMVGSLGSLVASGAGAAVSMATSFASMVAGAVSSAVEVGISIATQVAEWVMMGISSLASAAMVAAAWLLSIWPIALVIAAVVGLVVLIVKNWDTIKSVIEAGWKFVERISSDVWNGIREGISAAIGAVVSTIQAQINLVVSIFKGLVRLVGDAISPVADAITAPFKAAFNGIKAVWNSTIGGKGFDIPSWVPGIGGKSFKIPMLAAGGIVSQPTLALIGERGPEAVTPLGAGGRLPGGGPVQIIFGSDGSAGGDYVLSLVRRTIRNGYGGNIQAALG